MKIEEKTEEGVSLISCDYISFGDYDNSCAVERANVRYLEENNLIEQRETGCYGWEKAWLLDTTENRELLESLSDYPCFDDELVSQIEMEIEDEYLKDNDDIFRLYTPEPLKETLELLDRREIDRDAYEKAKNEGRIYFEVEAGGIGYIDLEKLAPAYNLILCDMYPELKAVSEMIEEKASLVAETPDFPIDFYDSADDMLTHRRHSGGNSYSQEETEAILKYAAELEEILERMRR